MLIVLSGGGTAGHINPALALAEVLQERGCEVRFAGTPTGVESRLVPQAGIPFKAFEASGFNRNHPLTLFKSLSSISKSTGLAKKWLGEIKPDVVVGFGGYVSVPVGRAAEKLHIPLVIHEQNSVIGLANKQLARKASKVCLTYACSGQGLANPHCEVTGNPVRKSVLSATRKAGRDMLGIPQDATVLLVFGGSLGARHINQAICAMKAELLSRQNLYVVHITGPKELDMVTRELALSQEEAKRYIVMGYQNKMGETLAAADCIVSRSGATSLAEISARGIPALLVPFPYATADHQTTNAKTYVEAGCAYLIADDQVQSEKFRSYVYSLIDDKTVRVAMHAAALEQNTAGAAQRLADAVLSVCK